MSNNTNKIKTSPSNFGSNNRKLQPKLRMFIDGDSEVNTYRAEHSACTAVTKKSLLKQKTYRGDESLAFSSFDFSDKGVEISTPPPLEKVSNDVLVNVFVETVDVNDKIEIKESVEEVPGADPEDSRKTQIGVTARRGNIATATVRLSQIGKLIESEVVTYVEPGQALAMPTPEISNDVNISPSVKQFGDKDAHKDGENILIGIIDVQGFDFTHQDFLKEDKTTRFVRIWDQGGVIRSSPYTRATDTGKKLFDQRFDYGSEIHQEEMNAALKAADELNVPAFELEPQSQMISRSHGTHVASIAAGNSGVCSKATIAAVLISLPEIDQDRRSSFYDSTRIAHAVDYLLSLGQLLKMPVSINISLGTNGHAHDASSAISRWIDSALSLPGRSVCVAAGNAGQQSAQFEGDLNYVMGRIHTSGKISSSNLTKDIEWEVIGNGRADISENEFEIWYAPQDKFAVSIRPPGSSEWIGPVNPLEYIQNRLLKDSNENFLCVLSIYNEMYHPANGSNHIAVYLTPFLKEPVTGIASGTWIVRLHGLDIRDGQFDGWIERDDPRRIGKIGDKQSWHFPSFFSEVSNVDESSVSSLACGQRIISVANLDQARERINITSSQGPTRDKRFKPDVAAPGTDIVAAYGFGDDSQLWVKMTGTSMASPFVTGLAGLMLAIEPRLTGAQIEGIIHRTSQPLPGYDFKWVNDSGFGRINPEACLEEARLAYQSKEI